MNILVALDFFKFPFNTVSLLSISWGLSGGLFTQHNTKEGVKERLLFFCFYSLFGFSIKIITTMRYYVERFIIKITSKGDLINHHTI